MAGMTAGQWASLAVAAILVFWMVGAYNRLVALRSAIGSAFQQVDELLRRRQAAVEPLVYGVAQSEQADYHMVDSLLNVTFGGVLGGGLHAIAGAIGDRLARWRGEDREAALRAAIAQLTEGRPVDVTPIAAAAEAQALRPVAPAPADVVFDASGRRLEVGYELVDVDSLVTSHRDDFAVNPAFPAVLQPRERGRAVSQAQVAAIAGDLQPERLGRSPDASTGAPIIGPDSVVESGNARVMALRQVYQDGRGAAARRYRQWLADQGFDIAGIDKPVLVRRRRTELTPDERVAFTSAAQSSGTLTLSSTERAMSDARILDGVLHLHEGGGLELARNHKFVRAFVSRLSQHEQGALLDKDGRLSREGHQRIASALLARAYGDADLVARMIESGDDGSKSLSGALLDVAANWARLRAAIAAGQVAPGADATAQLLAAARAIRDARATGRPLAEVTTQGDMFGGNDRARALFLQLMLQTDRRGRVGTARRDTIAERLQAYIDEAMKARAEADMFGAAPATAADILDAVRKRLDREGLLGAVDQVDELGARAGGVEEDLAAPQAITNPVDPKLSPQQKLEALIALTEENKPIVQDLIREIDARLGTRSGDSVKEPAKILEKAKRPEIIAKKPWHDVEHIRDSYRFKTVVATFDQIAEAFAIVRSKGIGIVKVDTAKLFDPKDWGWRIVAFDLRMPNGQLVEWYLPLRELEAAKKAEGHQLFENWRNKTDAERDARWIDYAAARQRSNELYSAAFASALERMGLSETEARASWSRLSTNFGSSRYTKLSATSSAEKLPRLSDQAPDASRTNRSTPSVTMARPSSGSSSAKGLSDIGASTENVSARPGESNPAAGGEGRPADPGALLGKLGDEVKAPADRIDAELQLAEAELARLQAEGLATGGEPELQAADQVRQAAEREGRAIDAAVMCMTGRGGA